MPHGRMPHGRMPHDRMLHRYMLHRTSVSVDVAVLERTFRQRRPLPGLALIDGLDAVMAAVDEDILAPITRSERAALIVLLDKIAARLPDYPRW